MRSIAFIAFPDFQVMNLAACTVFELANTMTTGPAYDIHFLSASGGRVRSSIGMDVETRPFDKKRHDTTIVFGALTVSPSAPPLLDYLRTAAVRSRRMASTCTGAFVLAEAGLLDGRRATTHWVHARELQRRHPLVDVEEDRIFIVDGNVWTSAGMTAGIDLALAMVQDDLGTDAAKSIARKLVVYHRRSGGQSQFSALLDLFARSDRVQNALVYARAHIQNELSVEELAAAAHLSPRQFSRVFKEETGQSPAKAVEHLRLEMARGLMEEGRHPIDEVAQVTGFADRERMRRAFLRSYGQPPQAIRRNARA